ncbi:Rieske (2Fe-2S) protein [Nocardia sp. NPDC059246]|uniref:Rieske (2Fe-2S) protein n=1 Tax=unclassified Nocardia TaxID=2637762 RepID=UPI0036C5E464
MKKHVVARVSDVPEGEHRIVEVNGRSIGIYNVGGTFRALLNRCPHQGAALCKGAVVSELESNAPGEFEFNPENKFVVCPWHGWEFELETGQSWFDADRTRVRKYDVTVEHGDEIAMAIDEAARQGGRVKGPYVAEVLQVETDNDYVVVSTPR